MLLIFQLFSYFIWMKSVLVQRQCNETNGMNITIELIEWTQYGSNVIAMKESRKIPKNHEKSRKILKKLRICPKIIDRSLRIIVDLGRFD